jgi:toxin YoeB
MTAQFRDDLLWWIRTDRKAAERLMRIVEETMRDPFAGGIGKLEPLQGDLAGCWSRRLNDTDRVVYRVFEDRVEFLQARYHY